MRTPLAERCLPTYSKGEEIFNMVSHIVGGAMGIAVLTLCIVVAAMHDNGYGVVAASIFGATMVLLYTMSSIYHGLRPCTAKKVFQVLDHCAIYLLIAGTYTPIVLSAIRLESPGIAWTIFGIEWGLAILSIVFTAIDLKKYEIFSMISYLIMGWFIAVFSKVAIAALTINGFVFLMIGGGLYTIGAILYGLGVKKKYMHNVFHLFVLAGSLFHFFCIVFYAL